MQPIPIEAIANVVFLTGSSVKAVMLTPTLRDTKAMVPLSTSVTTMICWMSFATMYLLMGMKLAAVATYLGGIMWLLVAIYRNGRQMNEPIADVKGHQNEQINSD
jgi:hypothetical protein